MNRDRAIGSLRTAVLLRSDQAAAVAVDDIVALVLKKLGHAPNLSSYCAKDYHGHCRAKTNNFGKRIRCDCNCHGRKRA